MSTVSPCSHPLLARRGAPSLVVMMLVIIAMGLFTAPLTDAKDLNETLRTFPFDLHLAVYGYETVQDFPLYVLDASFNNSIEIPFTGYSAANSNETYQDLNITRIVDAGIDFDSIIAEGDFDQEERAFIVERNFTATAVWGILGNRTDMEFAGIILSFFSVVEGKVVSMLIPQLPASYYQDDVSLGLTTCDEFSAGCDDEFEIGTLDHANCVEVTGAECESSTLEALAEADETAIDGRFGAGTTDELMTMFEDGESIQNFLADKAAAIIVAQLTRGCVECAVENELALAKSREDGSDRRRLCSFSCHPWSGCSFTVVVVVVVVVVDISTTIGNLTDAICSPLANITLSTGNVFVSGLISKDPHVTTFDGLKYECQARGHFTLVRSLDSPFEVQTRMRKARILADKEPGFDDDKGNSVINGVALMVGDEPVIQISEAVEPKEKLGALEISTCPISFYVDGEVRALSDGIDTVGDQMTVNTVGSHIGVNVPSSGVWLGIEVEWSEAFGCLLDVKVDLSNSFMESDRFTGLLGSPDGDQRNDWTDRDGKLLEIPPKDGSGHVIDEDKSRDYCTSSWCVQDEADSLFTYPAGGVLSFDYMNRCSSAKSMLRSANN